MSLVGPPNASCLGSSQPTSIPSHVNLPHHLLHCVNRAWHLFLSLTLTCAYQGALHDELAVHVARLHALVPESVESMERSSILLSSAWLGITETVPCPTLPMVLTYPP